MFTQLTWCIRTLVLALLVCSALLASISVEISPTHAASRGDKGRASGDFNGDGYADLAIGVPDEDITAKAVTISNAGAVNILYGGSGAGLSATDDEFLYQGGSDVAGIA